MFLSLKYTKINRFNFKNPSRYLTSELCQYTIYIPLLNHTFRVRYMCYLLKRFVMEKFEKSVPFDPGFSKISFSFIGNIQPVVAEYSKIKANHQKKFWLVRNEGVIAKFIEKSVAFYYGCMLWGSFIKYRFKDNPKIIEGNNTDGLSEEELKDFDCAYEAKAILEYIKSFNRDCLFFLKKPSKISERIVKILENYVEFAKINNNFIGIKKTDEIKLPADFSVFAAFSAPQLDKLCDDIYACIDSSGIEALLALVFN